jgi:hypothetical protein
MFAYERPVWYVPKLINLRYYNGEGVAVGFLLPKVPKGDVRIVSPKGRVTGLTCHTLLYHMERCIGFHNECLQHEFPRSIPPANDIAQPR